jgi:D-glycero-D-manno-heptose 1,7-bisphosphate phosphatase
VKSSKVAVFLDRDGVLNMPIKIDNLPKSPQTIEQVKIYGGAKDAINKLLEVHIIPVIITNQPEVARGNLKKDVADRINELICRECGITNIYTCFHDDVDKCECRKPKPGLLKAAALKLEINLNQSYLVGDRWKDIESAHQVGCKAYFIDHAYEEKKPTKPYIRVNSLNEAVEDILFHRKEALSEI